MYSENFGFGLEGFYYWGTFLNRGKGSRMHACMHACMYVCVCMYVYVCNCVYVCIPEGPRCIAIEVLLLKSLAVVLCAR